MENKKTIIFGLIALVILGGVVWYGSTHKSTQDQAASVLEQTQPEQSQVDLAVSADDLIVGNPQAPVTMIEYSSHFCTYCIAFEKETMPLLMEKYVKTGQMRVVYRLLSPLELGMAVLCANEQGSFEAMNNYLFENSQSLQSIDDLKKAAGELGMNQDTFNQCYDSEKYQVQATKWFDQAQTAAIEGTPTFYINGEQIVGNVPINDFETVIDRALGQ